MASTGALSTRASQVLQQCQRHLDRDDPRVSASWGEHLREAVPPIYFILASALLGPLSMALLAGYTLIQLPVRRYAIPTIATSCPRGMMGWVLHYADKSPILGIAGAALASSGWLAVGLATALVGGLWHALHMERVRLLRSAS
ncbi:MAG: hypothetical protein ACOYKZ_08265 [Chlamydiia bacterium]